MECFSLVLVGFLCLFVCLFFCIMAYAVWPSFWRGQGCLFVCFWGFIAVVLVLVLVLSSLCKFAGTRCCTCCLCYIVILSSAGRCDSASDSFCISYVLNNLSLWSCCEEFTSVCIIIESFMNILFFAGWPIKQIAFDLRWQWKWQGQEGRAWPCFFCLPSYISGLHVLLLLLLLPSQLYCWGSPIFFFFLCLPSYISGLHHSPSSSSSSAFPAISLGFTILLLLPSQLYLWASTFFFFCLPSYISGLHRSSSSAFPAISLGFTVLLLLPPSYISGFHCSSSSSSAFPAISLGFTVLFPLLLLPSQLYEYISGLHRSSSSSSSAFPAILLGFTILLLLLHSQLYLWGSPFFFFFCVPCYISGVHHSSSSSVFPAISLGFTILLHVRFQLYLCSSPFFLFCVPSYISGVHHSFSSAFPAISLGFTFLLLLCSQLYLWCSPFWMRILRISSLFNQTIEVVTFCLCGWCMLGVLLLPAFTCLGHECLHVMECMCAQTRPWFILSSERVFGEWNQKPC